MSSPTVKETLDLGAGLINVAGTAASGLLHVAADTAQALSEKYVFFYNIYNKQELDSLI